MAGTPVSGPLFEAADMAKPVSQLSLPSREMGTHYASLIVDPSRMTDQGFALIP